MSAEIVRLDEGQARRLTERIRLTAHSARESLTRLRDLVDEAQRAEVHVTLGYASWTAYLADVFGEEPMRLPRDQRQELVGYLAGEGMSTRAIAPIVGVDNATVHRDLTRVANATPAVNVETGEVADDYPEPPAETVAAVNEADEAVPSETVEPPPAPVRSVTGLDGKTYARPTPSAPKRKPLVDSFWTASYDLGKRIESVHRLTEDDRFPQNAEKVATTHRSDLLRYRDLLQEVIDRLPPA